MVLDTLNEYPCGSETQLSWNDIMLHDIGKKQKDKEFSFSPIGGRNSSGTHRNIDGNNGEVMVKGASASVYDVPILGRRYSILWESKS